MCPSGAELEATAQSSQCLHPQQGMFLAPIWLASERSECRDDGAECSRVYTGSHSAAAPPRSQ